VTPAAVAGNRSIENRDMRSRFTGLFWILGAALLSLPLSACAVVYRAEAIEGWVVDAEKGKPVGGVIVVAHWQLKGGFEGGNPVGELQILEAVTDANGRYAFPAWGPKFALSGGLRSESPEILMFKPGYNFQRLNNTWFKDRDPAKSDWNGKTVKLEPFKGTPAKYAADLFSLSYSLWTIGFDIGRHSGDYCGWKAFPRMLRALDELEASFRSAGVAQPTIASDLKANDKEVQRRGCGSVYEVLNKSKR
jgi:hypothetical protein